MKTFNTKNSSCKFVCPNCQSPLTTVKKLITCKACNSSWRISHNIPRFAETEVEWSVFDSEVSSKVSELAEKKGWEVAINSYSHTIGSYTLQYIKDESRADWHVILPIDQDSTVLDIGSGWGNIALSLSKWCKQVYCGDVNMTNLRLLNVRLRDNIINNVKLFQYEPNAMLRLPFADASVDVAVLNGVLEWMGAAAIDATPDRVQLAALKEIKRTLKPGGALYIGIENRYSTSTFRGQKMHGELPFVGLFPRWMSNLVTQIVRKEPHRTYIYSLKGYRRLLRQAGFENIDFYLPYPDYHHPNYLIPLEPSWVKKFWLDNLSVSRSKKFRLLQRLNLSWLPFHKISYSYSIRCIK